MFHWSEDLILLFDFFFMKPDGSSLMGSEDVSLLVFNVSSLILLPLAFVIPLVLIFSSFRIKFSSNASFLLIIFLVTSFFAGITGILCLYRHVNNLLEGEEVPFLINLLFVSQVFTRTIMSTTSSAIFVVKFLSIAGSSKETALNTAIGLFILMIVAKFCCATIIPEVTTLGGHNFGKNITCEVLETVEAGIDIVCLLFACLAKFCKRKDSVEPMGTGTLPPSPPRSLPSFLMMILNRLSLVAAAIHSVMNAFDSPNMLLPQDGFVVVHGIIIPLLLMVTIPSLRRVMLGMVSSHQEEEEFEMEPNPPDTTVQHRPSTAPTRPSSAIIPNLPGAPDMAIRVPYKSNIRKHRSALEAVVSVPRRRKNRIRKRHDGGPLDRVMLDMVGEKVIPLDESEEDEPSNCKTM
jgi:hypothetical protein